MPTFFYLENFVNVSGPAPPTAAQKQMNVHGRSRTTRWSRDRRLPVRRIETGRRAAVAGKGDAARGQKLSRPRLLRLPHGRSERAARPDGDLPAVRPEPRRRRVQGSPRLDLPLDPDPKAWNPEDEDAEPSPDPAEALDIAEYLSTLKAPPGFERSAPEDRTRRRSSDLALFRDGHQDALRREGGSREDGPPRQGGLHRREAHRALWLLRLPPIPGFEDAKPIGTELTEEGSKAVHRLDFGFVHLPHTRQDWFRTKLRNPRIFDRDRARGWEEKLRMPNFRLSKQEQEQVVRCPGPPEVERRRAAKKELDGEEAAIERGRRIVKNHNCQGCHIIEGFGGSFALLFRSVARPAHHPGRRREGAERLALRFLKAPKTGRDPAVARGPHADVRLHPRRTERSDPLLRLARPRSVSVPARRLPGRRPWAAGRKVFELLRCKQCHPRSEQEMNAPGSSARTWRPISRWLRPAAPRLDQRLDPPARRVDAGHPHADELPQGGRRQADVAACRHGGRARLREGPGGLRAVARRRRDGELFLAVPKR